MSIDLSVRIPDDGITGAQVLRCLEPRLARFGMNDVCLSWKQPADAPITSESFPLDLVHCGELLVRVEFFDVALEDTPASDADDDQGGLWAGVAVATRIDNAVTLMFLVAASIAAATGTTVIDEERTLEGERLLTFGLIDSALANSAGRGLEATSRAFIKKSAAAGSLQVYTERPTGSPSGTDKVCNRRNRASGQGGRDRRLWSE